MLFQYDLTVPADTAKASPATLSAPLSAGTVVGVSVQFPAGCSGLVDVSIWRSDHQLWPVNLDEGISGEDAIIPWPESYDLDDEPFAVTLKGWSPGTTYQHVITFRFALLPLEEARAARGLPALLRGLGRVLLGRTE